jgi:acyl-CoA thioester hydrolase
MSRVTHEKRIEVRWRDIDAFRHVNNSVYATYLEECRDEWVDLVLGPVADPWDFVLARVAIDFRNEVRQEDDAVIVSTTLVRIGTSSIGLREEIRKLDGTLAAEGDSVIVARDRETGRSRPLDEAERSALEGVLAAR